MKIPIGLLEAFHFLEIKARATSKLKIGIVFLIIMVLSVLIVRRIHVYSELGKQQELQRQSEILQKQKAVFYRDSLLNLVNVMIISKKRKEADTLLIKLIEKDTVHELVSDQFIGELNAYKKESESHDMLLALADTEYIALCKGTLTLNVYNDKTLNSLLVLELFDERNLRPQILKQRANDERKQRISLERERMVRLANCNIHRVRLECGRTSNDVAVGEYGSAGNVAYFVFESGVDVPCEEWVKVCCEPMGRGNGDGSDPAERMLNTYPWYRITDKL